jgi:hypothetical protein
MSAPSAYPLDWVGTAQGPESRSARSFSWDIHGQVRRAFSLSPQSVELGDELTSGEPFPAATVSVRPNVCLRSLTADCDPSYASVSIEQDRGDSSDMCKVLRVTPSTTLGRGPFAFAIQVQGETDRGELLPPQPVTVKGEVLPNVRPSPRTIDFGLLRAGENREVDLFLASKNGAAFLLTGVRSPKGVVISPSQTGMASFHRVSVVLQTDKVGKFHDTLIVNIRTADGTSDEITVPAQAYTIADRQGGDNPGSLERGQE